MKKILFSSIITLFTLNSCQKETVLSNKDQSSIKSQNALNASASDVAAVPFNITFHENLEGIQLYNSCTNELMNLHGSNHVVFHGFYDGPDSKTTFHYDLGTASALGESGRKYVVSGTLVAQEGVFSVGQFTFKFVNKLRFIIPGGNNNSFYELTHYLKVDADGNWTVIKAEVEKSYCQ